MFENNKFLSFNLISSIAQSISRAHMYKLHEEEQQQK